MPRRNTFSEYIHVAKTSDNLAKTLNDVAKTQKLAR